MKKVFSAIPNQDIQLCVYKRLLVHIYIFLYYTLELFLLSFFQKKSKMGHRKKTTITLDPHTGILYANRFLGAAINIQQQPLRHVFSPSNSRYSRSLLFLRIRHFSQFLDSSTIFLSLSYRLSSQFSRNIDERERKEGGKEKMETRCALQGRLVLSPQSPRESTPRKRKGSARVPPL